MTSFNKLHALNWFLIKKSRAVRQQFILSSSTNLKAGMVNISVLP